MIFLACNEFLSIQSYDYFAFSYYNSYLLIASALLTNQSKRICPEGCFCFRVSLLVPRVCTYVGCTEMGKMAGSPKTLQNLRRRWDFWWWSSTCSILYASASSCPIASPSGSNWRKKYDEAHRLVEFVTPRQRVALKRRAARPSCDRAWCGQSFMPLRVPVRLRRLVARIEGKSMKKL